MKSHTIQSLIESFDVVKEEEKNRRQRAGTTLELELLQDKFRNRMQHKFLLKDTFTVVDCSKRGVSLKGGPFLLELDLAENNESVGRKLKPNQTIRIELPFCFIDFFCHRGDYNKCSLSNKINQNIKEKFNDYGKYKLPYLFKYNTDFYVLKAIHKSTPVDKKSCFIATACTGSVDHRYVNDLREFRDKFMLNSQIGNIFVCWYYKKSPRFADQIAKNKISRFLMRNLFVRPLAFAARCITRN